MAWSTGTCLRWLDAPVDTRALSAFRCLYGAMVAYSLGRVLLYTGELQAKFGYAEINFRFAFAEQWPPLATARCRACMRTCAHVFAAEAITACAPLAAARAFLSPRSF